MSSIDPFLTRGGRLSRADFAALCAAGTVLKIRKRIHAAKVVSVARPGGDDLIVKVWHPKRRLSSARLYPYDLRFRKNAAKLNNLGFRAPTVRGWGGIGIDGTRFVCYEAVPGETLRTLKSDVDLRDTARFIARLHDAGVDFRSLHMGNILRDHDDGYSLIDLTDCRFYGRPLSPRRRAARLIYLCTHKRELAFMSKEDRWAEFLSAYCEASGAEFTELHRHAQRHSGWETLAQTAS